MANLGYYDRSNYPIDRDLIESLVPERPGNYALGYINSRGRFVPKYIGRSDSDLRQELLQQALSKQKEFGDDLYSQFMLQIAKTIRMAYEKECRNYHDFFQNFNTNLGGNSIHPAKPNGRDYESLRCPRCGE